MKTYELQPNAGRIINSLRDSGYDFNTAVADIVDNSIAAAATTIRIAAVCSSATGEISVAIADNGHGMNFEELCNAMTYGSEKREDEHSLGKFGLGLKTASTSQCRKVTLVSKRKDDSAINKLYLDIDHAEKVQRWEYIEDRPTRHEIRYLEAAQQKGSTSVSSGTVVLWEKCDRLMSQSFKVPGGKANQNAFSKKVDQLRFHLSLVFHRFLDRSNRDVPTVEIVLNGDPLSPYDPYALGIGKTTVCYEGPYEVELNNGNASSLYISAYVVPSRDELSPAQLEKVFPANINPDDMQGFFIYRENRLLHWGDWCGLWKSEFHQRLCRVAICFDSSLDDFFKIDFQKSKVQLDQELGRQLKESILTDARRIASERYRKGATETAIKSGQLTHSVANKKIRELEDSDPDRQFEVRTTYEGDRQVRSKKGRSFVEQIPEEAKIPNAPSIRTVEALPEASLWRAGLSADGDYPYTYVEINVSHPFYERAYYASKGNKNAIKCLDYLIWSLAQAEYATKDQDAMDHYEDMIREVSRTLRLLVDDLPLDES